MKIKKIENKPTLDETLDIIEKELEKEQFSFDNDEVAYEDMPSDIVSENDKIKYLENSEIIYFDRKKVYSVRIDEVGDYAIADFKIRKEIQEFIDSILGEWIMKKEKKNTLYPDNRKDFYSEFEDFLLVNSNLILLIGIIVLFSLFIIGCLLCIPLFQGEHVYNAIGRV